MNWRCPDCGETMQLAPYCGGYYLVCPRQSDGRHPKITTWTSGCTDAPPQDLQR